MSMATMTMAPASAGTPPEYDDRNQAIDALVNQLGWTGSRAANLFGISGRHARRIAREAREKGVNVAADSASALTPKEIETMARDYASYPYSSIEDREAALGWVAIVAQSSGVAEVGRIKFRDGIRVPAKTRDSFGQRPRVGQA